MRKSKKFVFDGETDTDLGTSILTFLVYCDFRYISFFGYNKDSLINNDNTNFYT